MAGEVMGHAVTGCPADLDATGRARWDLVVSDFGADWSDVFAATLERYVRYLAAADEANERLHWTEGDVDRGIDPCRTSRPQLTARGSQGQIVQHPLWKTWVEAVQGAAGAAEALNLTPRARQKAGEPKPPTGGGKFAGKF
jgi:hypothetical protein